MTRITAPSPPPSPPSSPPPAPAPAITAPNHIYASPSLSSPLSLPSSSSSRSLSLTSSTKPSKRPHVEWIPLTHHPVFTTLQRNRNPRLSGAESSENVCDRSSNLVAWDSSSTTLYLWDPLLRLVHRLSVRLRDVADDSDPAGLDSVEAAIPAEALVPSIQISYDVTEISLNIDGSLLLLSGSENLTLIYIHQRISVNGDTITCRASPVCTKLLSSQNKGLKILQLIWHPLSSSHLGLLTSDSVFRLFDLSADLEQPEQEFYLQPAQPIKCKNTLSICPVAFSYGKNHLWDQFSIFFLFSDGSIYVLCPVVPFGSLLIGKHAQEIYEDATEFGLKSPDPQTVTDSRLAIAWLEETYPELLRQQIETDSFSVIRAHPYAPLDSSLALQGPLCKIHQSEETGTSKGRALGFLYTSAGKDSILVTAFNTGQLTIDALADEVSPRWTAGSHPRLSVTPNGDIQAFAMICESNNNNNNNTKTDWWGPAPPLLTLAVVDLSLPDSVKTCVFSLHPDPLSSERFFCVHNWGADSVTLNFLPFSNIVGPNTMDLPTVQPVFTWGNCTPSSLHGFVTITDSFGELHLVGVTNSYDCVVVEMKGWRETLMLPSDDFYEKFGDGSGCDLPETISKEVLAGPRSVVVPSSASLRSMDPESIEGRSTLHHYTKIFLENYLEYAHKVCTEIKEHPGYLKTLIEEQQRRVNALKQLILKAEDKDLNINDRIDRAFRVYDVLEKRLENFMSLPAANKKPLTKAEKEFKSQLDRIGEVELDALQLTIEALNARMKRYSNSQASPVVPRQTVLRGRNHVSQAQISMLKSSLEKLSIINEENTQKLKLIENELKSQES